MKTDAKVLSARGSKRTGAANILRDAIAGFGGRAFTVYDVIAATDGKLERSQASGSLRALRDVGSVREMGVIKVPGNPRAVMSYVAAGAAGSSGKGGAK